jgi:hypothetical protein
MKPDTIKQRIEDHIKNGHKNSIYMLADFRDLETLLFSDHFDIIMVTR